MGCSWSLYFAKSVTEAIASRAPALNGLSPLHDTGPRRSSCMSTIWCDREDATRGRPCPGTFPSTNQNCHRWSNPWALSWTVSPFVAASVVRDSGHYGEPWMRFFGEERSLEVPLKSSLVTSLSCFSVPDLRCAHCTRVSDSCAHSITLRLASGQKLGPNWLRFEVF